VRKRELQELGETGAADVHVHQQYTELVPLAKLVPNCHAHGSATCLLALPPASPQQGGDCQLAQQPTDELTSILEPHTRGAHILIIQDCCPH
jgi:hypothetical protein